MIFALGFLELLHLTFFTAFILQFVVVKCLYSFQNCIVLNKVECITVILFSDFEILTICYL